MLTHHHGGNKIMSYTNWLIVKNKLKRTFQVIVPWSVLNISTTDLNDMEAYIEDVHFKHFHYPPTITNIFSLFCLFSPTIQQYNVKHYLELNVVRLQNYTFINLKLAEQFYLVSLHIPKIALVDYWHRWPQYLVLDQKIVIRWLCMCPLQVL